MGFWELLVLSIGLSMDSFAVSVCKGLAVGKAKFPQALTAGLYFAAFQIFMPFLGYVIGLRFNEKIQSVDHWIAFGLLVYIGIGMIRQSREKIKNLNASFGFKEMLPLALATSIDVLALGVTFSFLKTDIVTAVLCIGTATFVLSVIGVQIGSSFGEKYKSKSELFGGIVLCLVGLKILLEHLGVFSL